MTAHALGFASPMGASALSERHKADHDSLVSKGPGSLRDGLRPRRYSHFVGRRWMPRWIDDYGHIHRDAEKLNEKGLLAA
jgi:hypothetical protein